MSFFRQQLSFLLINTHVLEVCHQFAFFVECIEIGLLELSFLFLY